MLTVLNLFVILTSLANSSLQIMDPPSSQLLRPLSTFGAVVKRVVHQPAVGHIELVREDERYVIALPLLPSV